MDEWYFAANGGQQGPISQQALSTMLAQGQVSGDTLVWRAGMTDWLAAASVPELGAGASLSQPVLGYGVGESTYQ